MRVAHVALVSEATGLSLADLAPVSAAIQKQVLNDFGPLWDVRATVDPFPTLDRVPPGSWPIVIRDDIGINRAGAHHDALNRPFALVVLNDDWPLTASHEALEMLADPYSLTFKSAPSVADEQGVVEYLVEVCDPCGDPVFAYPVNGIAVSDFVTPQFYDPFAEGGARLSFAGHVAAPLQVLKGGYLSWRDPATGDWWQQLFSGSAPKVRELGFDPVLAGISQRGTIDRDTAPRLRRRPARASRPRGAAPGRHAMARAAQAARWRAAIDAIRNA